MNVALFFNKHRI